MSGQLVWIVCMRIMLITQTEALPFYWLAQALLGILSNAPPCAIGTNQLKGIRYGEMLKSARTFTRMGEGMGKGCASTPGCASNSTSSGPSTKLQTPSSTTGIGQVHSQGHNQASRSQLPSFSQSSLGMGMGMNIPLSSGGAAAFGSAGVPGSAIAWHDYNNNNNNNMPSAFHQAFQPNQAQWGLGADAGFGDWGTQLSFADLVAGSSPLSMGAFGGMDGMGDLGDVGDAKVDGNRSGMGDGKGSVPTGMSTNTGTNTQQGLMGYGIGGW